MPKPPSRYTRLLEHIFFAHFSERTPEFEFVRAEIEDAATSLAIKLPKNIGDVIYSFRFRKAMPSAIAATAPPGLSWGIRLAGDGRYRFALAERWHFEANRDLVQIKIPDATPGVIARYRLDDEQAILALVRYNRLLDIFLGIASYSLQNHLRTKLTDFGQVETDEIYVGVDRRGAHYVVPVQAKKGRKDRLNVVQIEQDVALCAVKFPGLICRPIGAQFLKGSVVVLQEFVTTKEGTRIADEKHYKLVPPDQLSDEDLAFYRDALKP